MGRQEQLPDTGARPPKMPAGIRRAVIAGVGLLMAGALYLIAVRGEVILAGLTSLAQLCF
jgi:hypothetical protein